MAKFGKWIGGGLGWAVGGPIGAIIGFAVGSLFDTAEKSPSTYEYGGEPKYRRHHTQAGDFGISMLVLSAAIMKADGRVVRSELNYVKQFLTRQFGDERAQEMLPLLREIIKQDIPIREVCEQIRQNMRHPLRLQLLHYLFGIAKADGQVQEVEINVITGIAAYLGISNKDFQSIKAMFYKDAASAYKILEVEKSASDEELKRAYRRMALKYHPDKVSHLGEEFQRAAKEKFQKVQEAWEQVKKERGI